jgi:hypothetical protein
MNAIRRAYTSVAKKTPKNKGEHPSTQRITQSHCGKPDIDTLIQDTHLDKAYEWLCHERKDRSHNNSVWDLRFHWEYLKPIVQEQLVSGTYQISPLRSYTIDGEIISSWEAMDSLVLKALSYTLQPLFTKDRYPSCTHLKNAGGIHGALRQVTHHKDQYHRILKSDVYHYYESIDHQILLFELKKQVTCERVEIRDGLYVTLKQGIPKGCPLSPLIAALYLKPLDDAMHRLGFTYASWMICS